MKQCRLVVTASSDTRNQLHRPGPMVRQAPIEIITEAPTKISQKSSDNTTKNHQISEKKEYKYFLDHWNSVAE